jgi:hypothetical protein
VTADLIQQDSLVEAVGSEPFAVSSDEDRLAAGVSTTTADQVTIGSKAEETH